MQGVNAKWRKKTPYNITVTRWQNVASDLAKQNKNYKNEFGHDLLSSTHSTRPSPSPWTAVTSCHYSSLTFSTSQQWVLISSNDLLKLREDNCTELCILQFFYHISRSDWKTQSWCHSKGHLMQETMTSFRDKPPQQMWIDQLLNGIQQWLNPNLMISSAPNNGLKGVEFQSLLTPNKCQELVLNFNSEAPSWWGRPFWPKRKNIIKWDKSSLENTVFYHNELRRGCNTRNMNRVHRTVSNDLSAQNSQESLCLRNQGMT